MIPDELFDAVRDDMMRSGAGNSCTQAYLYLKGLTEWGENPNNYGIQVKRSACHAFMSSRLCKNIDIMINFPGFGAHSPLTRDLKNRWSELKIAEFMDSRNQYDVQIKRFHNLLWNDEIFSQAFNQDQSDHDRWLNGCIVNMDCPQALAHTAMIAGRLPYEFDLKFKAFNALIDKGVPFRAALAFCECIRIPWNGVEGYYLQDYGGGHNIWNPNRWSKAAYVKLIKGQMQSTRGMKTYRGGYSGTCDWWAPTQNNWMSDQFSEVKGDVEVPKKEFCPKKMDYITKTDWAFSTIDKWADAVKELHYQIMEEPA